MNHSFTVIRIYLFFNKIAFSRQIIKYRDHIGEGEFPNPLPTLSFEEAHHLAVSDIMQIILRLTIPVLSVLFLSKAIKSDGLAEMLYQSATQRIAAKAVTKKCKNLIVSEYKRLLTAISNETPLPFEDKIFESECFLWQGCEKNKFLTHDCMADDCRGDNFSDASNPKSLQIAYLILAHKQPELVIRLIKALNEPGHIFVVHVDLKSAKVYNFLEDWAYTFNKRQEVNRKIYMVPKAHSSRVTWGGWSMVEATLACMRQARGTNHSFSWMMLISESSYPPIKPSYPCYPLQPPGPRVTSYMRSRRSLAPARQTVGTPISTATTVFTALVGLCFHGE